MKYLIVGLGNIGYEYENTRHNLGFKVLDFLAKESNISFIDKRYGAISSFKFKARNFILLKPSTFVNLSGKAVNYWMQKEKINISNVLVIVDDISLPLGTIRIRKKGGDAGHNGLKSIIENAGNEFARLRFGIGNDFGIGQQVNYVLGKWTDNELKIINSKMSVIDQIVKSFGTIGIDRTMNLFNKK